MNKTLTHSMKSYITIFLVGILVGCICRLTDYCPADTLWSFSSIQTLLGFWIITNTIIVLASTSNICAGISSFLYMFGMTLSFYGLQAILGTFIPLFSGGFRTSLFILFTICSIPCAIAAFILYYWNKEHIFNSILYSLPVGALAAEAIVIFIYFLGHHTFLFQLLMDVIGVLNNTQHDTTKKRSHKSGSSCYFRGMRGYISISKSSGFRRLPGTAIFL